jgi:hypothetical protein
VCLLRRRTTRLERGSERHDQNDDQNDSDEQLAGHASTSFLSRLQESRGGIGPSGRKPGQLARRPLGSFGNSRFAVLPSVNHGRAAIARSRTAKERQHLLELPSTGVSVAGRLPNKKDLAEESQVRTRHVRGGEGSDLSVGCLRFHFLQRFGHTAQGAAAGTVEGALADVQPAHDLPVGVAYDVGGVQDEEQMPLAGG